MNASAIATFLIIATFVWGGLVLILSTAFRREAAKRERAAVVPPPAASSGTPRATES